MSMTGEKRVRNRSCCNASLDRASMHSFDHNQCSVEGCGMRGSNVVKARRTLQLALFQNESQFLQLFGDGF